MAQLLTGTRIYGTGTVDTQLFVNGSNTATSTNTGALQVVGGVGVGGNLYVGSGTAPTLFTDLLGNVGIGTNTPTANLHVNGDLNSGIKLRVQNVNTGTGAFVQLNTQVGTNSLYNYAFGDNYTTTGRYIAASGVIDVTGAGGLVLSAGSSSSTANISFWTSGNNERVRISSAGTATIFSSVNATSTNTGALQVVGGVGIGGALYVGGGISGNLIGGSTGALVYQSATSTTAFLTVGSSGQILTVSGGVPTWTSVGALSAGFASTATNLAGGTAGQVPYQTAAGATSFYGPGTAGNVLVSNGTSAPTYNNTLTLTAAIASTPNIVDGSLKVLGSSYLGYGAPNTYATFFGPALASGMPYVGAGWNYVTGTAQDGYLTAWYVNALQSLFTPGGVLDNVSNRFSLPVIITNTTAAISTNTGALQVAGGVGINGSLFIRGDIATTSTTFNLINSTATTVNFAGAATTLNVGATSGSTNVRNNLIISGNLTVQGTTTIVDSTVTNIADPIITLGGGSGNNNPTTDDNKDRGIAFKWVNNGGTTSTGFFGYDDSTGFLTYIQTATITNEVVSGTKGAADINLAGGAAMSLVYQSSANNTGFLAAGTSGYILQTNGTGSAPSWVAVSGLSAGSSTYSDQIRTVAQSASASYYPTFVDSNNATNAYEAVYTTSSFSINPATGAVNIGGTLTAVPTLNLFPVDSSSYVTEIKLYTNTAGTAFHSLKNNSGAFEIGTNDANPVYLRTNGSTRIMISAAGLVGVGTTNPSTTLDVGGTIGFTVGAAAGIIRRTTVNGSNGIRIQGNASDTINTDAAAGAYITVGGGVIGDTYEGNIDIVAYGGIVDANRNQIRFSNRSGTNTITERMRINKDGNVGIGTTDPTAKFQVQLVGTASLAAATIVKSTDFDITSRAGFSGLTNNSDGIYFGMGANGTGIPAGLGFFREASGWNTALAFYTNSITSGPNSTAAMQEKMRITSAGGISFGATGTAYGSSGQVLQSNGNAAPTWVNASSIAAGSAPLTNTYVGFGSASNLLTGSSSLTWSGSSLYVNGGIISNSNAPFFLQSNGNTDTYTQTVVYSNQNNTSNSASNGIFIERGRLTNSSTGEIRSFVIGSRGGEIQVIVNKDGNVGIGTASPNSRLEVYQTLGSNSTLGAMITINPDFGSATTTGFGGSIVWRGRTPGNVNQINAQISAYNEDTGDNGYALGFYTTPNASTGITQRMTILRGGNVGIGNTSPQAPLSFANGTGAKIRFYDTSTDKYGIEVQSSELRIYSGAQGVSTGGITFGKYDGTTYTEAVRIRNDGNVGVGTTAPRSKFESVTGANGVNTNADVPGTTGAFVGPTGTGQGSQLSIESNDAIAADTGGVLAFGGRYSGSALATWAAIKGLKEDATSGNYGGYLSFYTRTNGAGYPERMRITPAGGISFGASGTAYGTSGQILQSNGNAAPTWVNQSSITAGYASNETLSTVATRGNSYINPSLGGISIGETFVNYAGWSTQLNVHGVGGHSRVNVKTDTVQMGVYAHNSWQGVSGVTPGGFIGTYNDYPLSFLVNTSQKMVINTSGNVGIGTTAPISKLQVGSNTFSGVHGVYGNARSGLSVHGSLTSMMYASTYNDSTYPDYGMVFVHGPSTSNYNVWSISPDGPAKGSGLGFLYGNTTDNIHIAAPKVYLQGSTGNVGIGTSTPPTKLSINSSSHTSPADTNRILNWYGTTGGTEIPNSEHSITVGNSSAGTTQPAHVGLSLFNNNVTNNIWSPAITFGGKSTSGNFMNGSAAIAAKLPDNPTDNNFRGGDLHFFTQGTTSALRGLTSKMVITANGNVAIGTTATINRFEVVGTAGQLFSVSDSFTGTIFSVNDVSGIPSIEVLDTGLVKLAQYNGQVAVSTGTIVAGSALSVYGIISTIGSGGEIRASSEIVAYYSSDARLKENVIVISNPIEMLNQIRGVYFDWTDKHIEERGGADGVFVRKHDVGVIAQEIESILPEIVTTRDNGYKAVKYEKLVPLLIEAIKEQQKTIDTLVKDLDDVKEFINNLKNGI